MRGNLGFLINRKPGWVTHMQIHGRKGGREEVREEERERGRRESGRAGGGCLGYECILCVHWV